MAEVAFSDLTDVEVGVATKSDNITTVNVAKDLMAKLKETNPTLEDRHTRVVWGVIMLRLAIKTTSGKSTDDEVTSFKIGGTAYSFRDSLILDVISKHPLLRTEKNPLRHWARGCNEIYLAVARKTPSDIMAARALKCALPKEVAYLCADFLTGDGLTEYERTCYFQAQKHMLQEKASGPVSGAITTIANLGTFTG